MRRLGGRAAVLWTLAAVLALAVAAAIAWRTGAPGLPALVLAPLAGGVAGWAWARRRHERRLERPLGELTRAVDRLADGLPEAGIEAPAVRELEPLVRAVSQLVESGRSRQAALEDERDDLRQTLASMSEGVLVTGPGGRVRLVNPAFRRLIDLAQVPPGASLLDLTRRPELHRLVQEAAAGGAPPEARLGLASGRVLVAAAARFGDGGAVLVVRDDTEQTRLEATRRDFVANISHELRTPLAAIRGYAETLQGAAADDPASAARFLKRILAQCRRLEALLDDLLALARMESAEFAAEENRRSVDLAAVARRAIETVGHLAEERRIRVRLEAGEVPRLAGYPDALERLLLNLLENAVKYNRQGGTVTVRLAADNETGLELEVADTGIGIPAEARPRIFERFYRVDQGRARDEGGTGLGLALVKHATRLHGGTIEVESEPGRGSTFRVRLPLAGGAAPRPGAPAAS